MKNSAFSYLAFCLVLAVIGCGSSNPTASTPTPVAPTPSPTPAASFTLVAAPGTINLMNGGPAQMLTVAADPANGFNNPVTVSVNSLPAGVTASPASVSVTPGQLQQISLSASGAAVGAASSITVIGTSGSITQTATASVAVAAASTTASLSNASFDFGGNLVGNALVKTVATVTNTGTSPLALNPALAGDPSYTLVAGQSCGMTLASGASCPLTVSYTPTTASGSAQTAVVNLGFGDVPANTPQTVSLTGISGVLPAGTVATTNNPQVALYTMNLPFPGSVTVSFGPDTSYGRKTWTQSTAVAGPVSIFVAGMLANTTYHMQSSVQFTNGLSANDIDQTFAVKPPAALPNLTATTTAGMTPQPGVEQLALLSGPANGLVVTDLQANVLWTYLLPNDNGSYGINGAKLLPNGHFLLTIGQGSSISLQGPPAPGIVYAIREIDLAGNLIREITPTDLTNELVTAGYNIPLQQFHHDITPLPNGHWIVLANTLQPFTDLPGYPGVTNVLGDVIIDLDQNLKPVWVWNEFDHLDVNRHPMNFPDWTHTNAVIYSPSDGNLIVSVRHQNWVLKVDYADGTGAGDILWHLGEGGDFTLQGGTDPTDWQYAQHFPSLFSPNSSGVFSLGLMDNGDDRIFPAGVTCGSPGAPACHYTTIPVFQLDEGAKTATFTFHQILPTNLYSFYGGNTELLTNGNIEYDLAGTSFTDSDLFEVTPTSTPETVWHMHMTNNQAYRGYRIPSLYPGIQWQ